MAPPHGDIENGDVEKDLRRESAPVDDDAADAGEYGNLVRYISTYKDGRRASIASQQALDEHIEKKAHWWSRKGKNNPNIGAFETPEEWLTTNMQTGLKSSEVEQRRKKSGWNELTTEKENLFLKFIGFFRGPVLYVMELAVILAAGLRDWIDFGVIIGILLLNAVVGWYQEKQAPDVVASLKGDIAMRSTVVRDGQELDIKARELVPRDIIIVEDGQVVPADARIICAYDNPNGYQTYLNELETQRGDSGGEKADDEDHEMGEKHGSGYALLAIDQSAMTGESLAVDKYVADVIYYTTGCKRGKAYCVVTHSAKMSFVGRTASLVSGAKDQGHFKAIMNSIGTSLLVLVVFWILIAWIGGFFRNLKIATPEDSSVNLLHYALILLIVGVPVGLPVVTTTTLAVGAAYLAEEKAIVQKLTAIESLAGVDVLCSDKTGTLTANQLSIREPFVADGIDVNWMMAVAALASSHNVKSLDPIDKVTILTLKRYPKAKEILAQGWRTEKFTPFDPVSKRITAIVVKDGITYTCAKGAPKAVLNLTNCSKEDGDMYKAKTTEFARRGFRSLGVAVKKGDEEWQLLGMLPMFDPPREDTASTIAEAQVLGLSVKMLTGDAIAIAKETCKMLALGTKVYNSDKLIHGGLSGTTQHDLVEKADGFAEVFPEHKYQVVEMLQQRGHLTAMTGDGVNDAPSLKKADTGIAVEGASDAARSAADIVFLAPGLGAIIDALKTSRQIFHRMYAYVVYRIALSLHMEIFLGLWIAILNRSLNIELVVFIAIFADVATLAIAYDNAPYSQTPVKWNLPKLWGMSVLLGVVLAVGTWIALTTMYVGGEDGGIVQNFGNLDEVIFLEISLTENWLIFITRANGPFWSSIPSWQLTGAILLVDILATLFCLFGWFIHGNPHTSIVAVVRIWIFSFGIFSIMGGLYYFMQGSTGFDNLMHGKSPKKDQKQRSLEDFVVSLQRVSTQHEKSQ